MKKNNLEFFQDSPSPERMFENFLGRSLWFNNLIKEQATQYQMHILYQTGKLSVDELCQKILDTLR